MLVFFNWAGLAMFLAGIILGIAADAAIGGKGGIITAGLAMVAIDLIYRNRNKDPLENTPFFSPKRGGNIMFIPVWIIGAIIFVVGLS